MTQVIIPAHDEAAVIDRCLRSVLAEPQPADLDVLVVCNGCTDETAAIARAFGSGVRVAETPTPSKAAALDLGDDLATGYPRVYLDADVELRPGSLAALVLGLDHVGVEAVAPRRELDLTGAGRVARSYAAIWSALPSVLDGLSGRGAYAFSEAGRSRFDRFDGILADDLFVHTLFTGSSARVVEGAVVVVRPPRTFRSIIDRRARTLNLRYRLAESHPELQPSIPGSATSWLVAVRRQPGLVVHVPAFVTASVAARALAHHRRRTGQRDRWVRDDSSRADVEHRP